MDLLTIFKGLPADARRAIDELVDTPEARAFLDRSDAARVERRKAALATIARAETEREAESAPAAQAVRDAVKAYAKAEAELHAAERRHRDAQSKSYSVGAEQRRAIRDAEQELAETADGRLDEYRRHVLTVENMLRLTVRNSAYRSDRNILGRWRVNYESNAEAVAGAMKLCRNCLNDLQAMAREALTRHEITERLASWSETLDHATRPFDLPAPMLDERGEVAPLGVPGRAADPEAREQATRQLERDSRPLLTHG